MASARYEVDFERQRPPNPAELARPYAMGISFNPEFHADLSVSKPFGTEFVLGLANSEAEQYELLGKEYLTSATLGFFIRHAGEGQTMMNSSIKRYTGKFHVDGNFCTYAVARIGISSRHADSVRAMCMVFDDAMVWPTYESTDDESMFYVPIMAIYEQTTKNDSPL